MAEVEMLLVPKREEVTLLAKVIDAEMEGSETDVESDNEDDTDSVSAIVEVALETRLTDAEVVPDVEAETEMDALWVSESS